MVVTLRRLWNWVRRRKPEPPKEEWHPEDDPMYQEAVMRAFRSGKMVVGNRDSRGVTFTEHEITK